MGSAGPRRATANDIQVAPTCTEIGTGECIQADTFAQADGEEADGDIAPDHICRGVGVLFPTQAFTTNCGTHRSGKGLEPFHAERCDYLHISWGSYFGVYWYYLGRAHKQDHGHSFIGVRRNHDMGVCERDPPSALTAPKYHRRVDNPTHFG